MPDKSKMGAQLAEACRTTSNKSRDHMTLPAHKSKIAAFNKTELLVVIAIIGLLAGILFPSCSKEPRANGPRFHGDNNLKQIGLAMRLFANDHDGKLPMEVSQANGGVREIFEKKEAHRIYRTFAIMSNDLGNNPRVLVDPADEETIVATTFNTLRRSESDQVVFDGNVHTSFGIAPGAENDNARMLLSANRDIEDEVAGFRYGKDMIAPLGTNNTTVHWTEEHVHRGRGYALWADGSVTGVSSEELRDRLRNSGNANVWAQPGNPNQGK